MLFALVILSCISSKDANFCTRIQYADPPLFHSYKECSKFGEDMLEEHPGLVLDCQEQDQL